MSPSQHPNHGEAVLNDMENRVPYPHVASEEDLRAHFITLAFRDLCSQSVSISPRCVPPPPTVVADTLRLSFAGGSDT